MIERELFEISTIDKELFNIKRNSKINEIYEGLKKTKGEFDKLKREYDCTSEEIKKLDIDNNRTIKKIDELNGALKDNEYKLYHTSSLKTIEGCQKNIINIKENIEEIENKLCEGMILDEELKKKRDNFKKSMMEIKELYERDRIEYERERKNIKDSEAELNNRREKLKSKIDSNIYLEYERLREKYLSPVSILNNGRCKECGIEIPTELLSQLMKREEYLKCPYCKRFLYTEE